jgi:thymidine phosphorylase
VPSIPLITASILSKKLAENLDALVLDVKFGCAAFMQTRTDARKLAKAMVALGNECGVNTRAVLTDMNTPLGRAAGNWLEVKESVTVLDCRTGVSPVLRCIPQPCRLGLKYPAHFIADLAEADKLLTSFVPFFVIFFVDSRTQSA